jgi:threonyl-tRNA synthetase
VWLAPVQVAVISVSPVAVAYGQQVRGALVMAGRRADIDDRDATLAARVRDAQHRRAPYVAVVGEKEAASGSVAVRLRSGERLPAMLVEEFVSMVSTVAAKRGAALLP